EERLAEIFANELDKFGVDEPATARLARRTGELLESLGGEQHKTRALQFYRRAYQFDPEEQQEAFQAIDRLLAEGARAAERVALYRDALDYRTEPAERIATLYATAAIEENDLGDDEAAILTLRSVLDVDETEIAALD